MSHPGDPPLAAISGVWRRIEELCNAAADVSALRHHGLELIAARMKRDRGMTVPADLLRDELRAAFLTMSTPAVLGRVRAAYDGRLVLMKGPEIAACYPAPALRPFVDVDILADDPQAAQCALLAAGFVAVDDHRKFDDAHHLPPLVWPGLPLFVELHREPNHPQWLEPPPAEEIFRFTRSSATGIVELCAPSPGAHAVLLALHSWAHAPLRRLADLIDVTLVLEGDEDRDEASALARRWGLDRVWRTTLDAADSILRAHRRTPPVRLWGRHLEEVRERTVVETHLTRWAGPTWGLPRHGLRAVGGATAAFGQAAWPRSGECWADATRRTCLALANAARPQSEHDLMRKARGLN